MNEQMIIAVANAITANAEALKALIETLPKSVKAEVEQKVAAPVPQPQPMAPAPTPVVASPAPTPAPMPMPAPTPAAPVVAPVVTAPVAPVMVSPSSDPWAAYKGQPNPFKGIMDLNEFVMQKYRALGPIRGMEIQDIMTAMGDYKNINKMPDEIMAEFKARVEAIVV